MKTIEKVILGRNLTAKPVITPVTPDKNININVCSDAGVGFFLNSAPGGKYWNNYQPVIPGSGDTPTSSAMLYDDGVTSSGLTLAFTNSTAAYADNGANWASPTPQFPFGTGRGVYFSADFSTGAIKITNIPSAPFGIKILMQTNRNTSAGSRRLTFSCTGATFSPSSPTYTAFSIDPTNNVGQIAVFDNPTITGNAVTINITNGLGGFWYVNALIVIIKQS